MLRSTQPPKKYEVQVTYTDKEEEEHCSTFWMDVKGTKDVSRKHSQPQQEINLSHFCNRPFLHLFSQCSVHSITNNRTHHALRQSRERSRGVRPSGCARLRCTRAIDAQSPTDTHSFPGLARSGATGRGYARETAPCPRILCSRCCPLSNKEHPTRKPGDPPDSPNRHSDLFRKGTGEIKANCDGS